MPRGAGDDGMVASAEKMTRVRVRAAGGVVEVRLHDNAIAKAITQRLPMSATVRRWGDEIYFDVPLKLPNERPTRAVKVGDLAYWPDGPCLCIFFGKTPASTGREPRPASDVTIVGHTDVSPARLRSIVDGTPLTLERIA
jgi:hypothetical protein